MHVLEHFVASSQLQLCINLAAAQAICPTCQAQPTRALLPAVFMQILIPQDTSNLQNQVATHFLDMLPYRYRPLEHADSIRVLVLHPSSQLLDPLVCTIQHARLSDATIHYEAVSYTWGDTTHGQVIYVHNGPTELRVGANCCSALRHIRQQHRNTLLWIDAICIDQENITERSTQVRIMDNIFHIASSVTVYLGDQTRGSQILFEELAEADKWLSQGRIHERPAPSAQLIKELEILFQRPWFSRVWVLQEVRGQASPTFRCGAAHASAEALLELVHGYRDYLVTKDSRPLVLDLLDSTANFSTPHFTLWHLLYRSRKCLATDARDRVFALKSLLGSRQSVMDYLIDYTKSFEDTCFETTMFLVPVLGLRILTAIRQPHELNMPSWVPDWSQNLPLNYKHFNTEPPSKRLARGSEHPGELKHGIRMVHDRDNRRFPKLLITGCQYARIVSRSGTFRFTSLDDARAQIKSLCRALENLREFFGLEGTADDYARDKQLNKEILKAMSSIEISSLSLYLSRGYVPFPMSLNHPSDDDENMRHFFESLQQCRIVLMNNNELAIMSDKVEDQDVLCVLSGTAAPCALRWKGSNNWTLISGDCFIFSRAHYSTHSWDFEAGDYLARNHDRMEEFSIQ